jgi:hypothetical protein
MHLRAEYQGIITPIMYQDLTPGKLEEQLRNNPPADSKEVKKVKRLIRLAKEEESE